MAQVISVVSGKGGVGKSTFVANLGKALADSGRSVVVIDTDIGLRSQDFLLSLENQVFFDLIDVTSGNCELSEAILPVSSVPNLFLVPAAQFSRVRALEPKKLRKMLRELKERYDFVLIDCPAGIERGFRNVLASGSDSFVLMVTPDDLCVRDAERTQERKDLIPKNVAAADQFQKRAFLKIPTRGAENILLIGPVRGIGIRLAVIQLLKQSVQVSIALFIDKPKQRRIKIVV